MVKIEKEKNLEAKLRESIKKLGGIALKVPAVHFSGIPDRLCLLPGGKFFFVELKTTNKKPTPLQLKVHSQLTSLGFSVYVVDNSETLNDIIKKETL